MKIFILFCLALTSLPSLAQKAWLVVNEHSGKIILEHNSSNKLYPASLTKMMTIYITFDALKKNIIKKSTLLTTSKKASKQPASKLGLKQGEKITVKTALLSLIIKSANDSAVVLSEHLSGKEKTFASIMTKTAKQIGLSKTNFENASGLGNNNQVSSAKDIALLGLALYRHFPNYYKWFSKKSFTYKGKKIKTHNHLFKRYLGVDGLKTGYIKKSGYNSIVSSKQQGKRLFGVVLGADSIKERDDKMISILNKGFRKLGVNPKQTSIKGGYIVQLGAFSNLQNAKRLINSFNEANKIKITKIDNKILYLALLQIFHTIPPIQNVNQFVITAENVL